jgi:hypothetical protein
MSRKLVRPTRTETFNPDYSHIKKDLRRIAIIAGSFVVVMIVLSFIIK